MLLVVTALSLQLAATAPNSGQLLPPAPRIIDQNIGGPIFATLYGLNLLTTGPLQATVVVSASTGTELHRTPNASSTLKSLLDGRTWGNSMLLAQGNEFAVTIGYANVFPSPGMNARFARFSPVGQLTRSFTYLVDNGPFASTSVGEFQILGRTLRPVPENTPAVDLAWCGVDCGFAGNGTFEAKMGGAWFVRRFDCALMRVGRDGNLLETLSLPIPSAECNSLQFSRDSNQSLRIARRAGSDQVYALNINDEGPANIVAGLILDARTSNNHPLSGGDWLLVSRVPGSGDQSKIARWHPHTLQNGLLTTPSLQWETTKSFAGSGLPLKIAASLDGAIAICSSAQGFRLNALGQEVQALPGASAVAFDPEHNLALLRHLGLPKDLDWYSPAGDLLRSDALGPAQTLAYSAQGRYDGAGQLNVQYNFVTGQLGFNDIRQYAANDARLSSYSALGRLQSTGRVSSDYWYNLRTDAQGGKSMLVRHLPSQTSTLVPIPCTNCESLESAELENGLLLYVPYAQTNQKLWLFQGAELHTIPVYEFERALGTPLHPAGDIARFIGATAIGQPRMVLGIDESGNVSSRFSAPEATFLEPSGGLYGRDSSNARIKIDADGVLDPTWMPCGAEPLVFSANGHWAWKQFTENTRVICFSSPSGALSALTYGSNSYPNMESAFGPRRKEILVGNQLYAIANDQILVRTLVSYPVALNDEKYAYFTKVENGNYLTSLPVPPAQALDHFIFAHGFEE